MIKKILDLFKIVLLVVICIGVYLAYDSIKHQFDGFGFGRFGESTNVESTIKSIETIGQWEFLTISEEVEVEIRRNKWFGLAENRLVRRYQGKLSLGIDMSELDNNWANSDGETIYLHMPKIKLLDDNFIDEGNSVTVSGGESGEWEKDTNAKQALYEQAKEKILSLGYTQSNIDLAEKKAHEELTRKFKACGYKRVIISFGY